MPLIGPVLYHVPTVFQELYRSRWYDLPSLGRAAAKQRCVALGGPDVEASSLAIRALVPSLVSTLASTAAWAHQVSPSLDAIAIPLSLLASVGILAIPIQVFIGNGRTWVDRLANTQVIRDPDAE